MLRSLVGSEMCIRDSYYIFLSTMCRALFIQNEKVDTIRRIAPISSNQFAVPAYTQLNTHYHLLPNYYTFYGIIMRSFIAYRQKSLFIPGCLQGAILFNLSVGMCVCVCVTFVVFTDCERCTRPISTNPGSMEAGECGLTRGTCCVARSLELVAVAGLLWISWCVLCLLYTSPSPRDS